MAVAFLPIIILCCTINHITAEIIAIAINTESSAENALPNRSRSKKRAIGNSEMDINVANKMGNNTPCETYISAIIKTNANKLEARSSAYDRLGDLLSIVKIGR